MCVFITFMYNISLNRRYFISFVIADEFRIYKRVHSYLADDIVGVHTSVKPGDR